MLITRRRFDFLNEISAIVRKKFGQEKSPTSYEIGLFWEFGSSGWIRTSDQRINSPLRYRCATEGNTTVSFFNNLRRLNLGYLSYFFQHCTKNVRNIPNPKNTLGGGRGKSSFVF